MGFYLDRTRCSSLSTAQCFNLQIQSCTLYNCIVVLCWEAISFGAFESRHLTYIDCVMLYARKSRVFQWCWKEKTWILLSKWQSKRSAQILNVRILGKDLRVYENMYTCTSTSTTTRSSAITIESLSPKKSGEHRMSGHFRASLTSSPYEITYELIITIWITWIKF